MNVLDYWKKFWAYLKKDSWDSWVVSLLLTFVLIKFVFFPVLSFITGAPLPLVVVESCSMYHSSSNFNEWWQQNGAWYEDRGITKEDFESFGLKNGLNKGDVIFVWGRGSYNVGDIIIFNANYEYPIIHRLIDNAPLSTKGDNNFAQLEEEKKITQSQVLGKAVARIPEVGWLKLIFFEGSKPEDQRGFC